MLPTQIAVEEAVAFTVGVGFIITLDVAEEID